ncbi:MAG: hypothetical protein ACON5A_02875 [Candidatus Comchoanobacterales bacterium]
MSAQFKINCLLLAKQFKSEPTITILLGNKEDIIADQMMCHPHELIHAICHEKTKQCIASIIPGDPIEATGELKGGQLYINNISKLKAH